MFVFWEKILKSVMFRSIKSTYVFIVFYLMRVVSEYNYIHKMLKIKYLSGCLIKFNN